MKLWSFIMAVIYMWKRRRTDREGWDIEKVEEQEKNNRLNPQFKVMRTWFTEVSTISKLFIEGNFKCFILEDATRDHKIPDITAIPCGTYELIVSYSNKFKKHLPLLLNVPDYKGIRIHPGNSPSDTSGCLLPGIEKSDDDRKVFYSRKAFSDIFELLKVMCAHEKVWIQIMNEREEIGKPRYT